MHDIAALQQRITQGLTNISMPKQPENLYDPIRYVMQLGGKRIRPLLTLMSADLFAIPNIESALPAALAIELFHNFSLVHDDIMDNAPLRRGQQTVHERWNDNIAILSGDNLLIMAYGQLAKCDRDKLPSLLDTFNTMASEVCEGQQLDMDFEKTLAVNIDEYMEMVKLKTSVLLGSALKMGAILGDANETDAQLIYEFGVNVGIAFQLQDDILDVYGDPLYFGKQQGGDILANKKTYLLVKALETTDTEIKSELAHWLSNDSHPQEKIDGVTTIYNKLGVQSAVEAAKQLYIEQAFRALDSIPIGSDRKLPLRTLAQNLLDRAH